MSLNDSLLLDDSLGEQGRDASRDVMSGLERKAAEGLYRPSRDRRGWNTDRDMLNVQ